ncbi:MAG TPA: class I SAM-dependent methyltransferase [Tepidisphaeraceae bacterium]|jgi:SAM-dependent methyltransferase|nr:class I SAM-dependent methyltransferase [Tepidisphaeraceae bacterium]
MRSYTSLGGNLLSQLREFRDLARGARNCNPAGAVEHLSQICFAAEQAYQQQTGRDLQNTKALEIGPGTAMGQLLYFAQKCDVVGIDLDVMASGWNPLNYLRVLRGNGLKRFLKTIGRKMIVSDRVFREAIRKKLGVAKLRHPKIMQMDAARMSFADATFDFVYSFNVFEHIPDPAAVLRDVRRVLKPGGVVYTHLHLFTCDSGFHDLRIISGKHEGIPYWAHLRPSQRDQVKASSYLNGLRLGEWQKILAEALPGASINYHRDENLRGELDALRKAGELAEYSDDELLIHSIISVWKKP